MMTSSIRESKAVKAGAIAFWLIVWEAASLLIGEELFLPSPVSVAARFIEIVPTSEFWTSVFFTLRRILLGFLLSVAAASLAASLPSRIAQTTNDWPRCMSPAVNIFSTLVWYSPEAVATFDRGVRSTPKASAT